MNYWLLKSEPTELSIGDLANLPNRTVAWFGVRNYQARNYMKDAMQIGDKAFFYHSSCAQPGIVGLVEIVSNAYPDETQFHATGKYFDAKATRTKPRWFNVDVRLIQTTRLLSLAELRGSPPLTSMRVLAKGNRLSITPVTFAEWDYITRQLLQLAQ